tara:strand:- start:32 stop:427 length:396 start_codon:yes stop_codon:yes gene_type:complete
MTHEERTKPMQDKLSDIIDLVWDIADLAIDYGHHSSIEPANPTQHIMQVCGLVCVFEGENVKRLLTKDMDLHFTWSHLATANDNADDAIDAMSGLHINEIFPASATFVKGDMDNLKKWHSDLSVLRGALVA